MTNNSAVKKREIQQKSRTETKTKSFKQTPTHCELHLLKRGKTKDLPQLLLTFCIVTKPKIIYIALSISSALLKYKAEWCTWVMHLSDARSRCHVDPYSSGEGDLKGRGGTPLIRAWCMGTCGQPGYVCLDFCLKRGIDFFIFCLKPGDHQIFSWTINSLHVKSSSWLCWSSCKSRK